MKKSPKNNQNNLTMVMVTIKNICRIFFSLLPSTMRNRVRRVYLKTKEYIRGFSDLLNEAFHLNVDWRKSAMENLLTKIDRKSELLYPIKYIFTMPLFSSGGAELVARNFMNLILNYEEKVTILLIITDSTLMDTNRIVSPSIICINLNEIIENPDINRKKTFLMDVISTIKPKFIHNINSSVMWELIREKGEEIREFSYIFAHIFAFQFDTDGNRVGYAENYLRDSLPFLNKLFSDNNRFIQDAISHYKLGEKKNSLQAIYTPVQELSVKEVLIINNRIDNLSKRLTSGSVLNCVWAGRLDKEKKIDLFFSIVKKADFCNFSMYGKAVVNETPVIPQVSNLFFYGEYQSSSTLFMKNTFDVLIFTSRWEGLPNILLEAGIHGILIIAPDVGGVRELISNKTGYLLPAKATEDDYINALKSIKSNPEIAQKKARALYELIYKRHSWQNFVKEVQEVPNYLESKTYINVN